jgi:hypothetical protein
MAADKSDVTGAFYFVTSHSSVTRVLLCACAFSLPHSATLHTYAIICLGTAPFVLRLMLSLTATYTAIISDAYIGRRSPAIIGLTTKPWPPTLPQ